jgi:hypothetical protein
VACKADARRKFYEARGSDALQSHQALAYYRQLDELERQAKDFSDAQRLQMRQDVAVPTLEQLQLARLPATPAGQHGDLLPDHWQAARPAQGATPAAPQTDASIPPPETVADLGPFIFVSRSCPPWLLRPGRCLPATGNLR